MMAAMMLPSMAPMALVFARITGERSKRGQAVFVPTWIFILGYFAAWTAFGSRGVFDRLLHSIAGPRVARLGSRRSDCRRSRYRGRWSLSADAIQAGVSDACRSPLDFFLGSWRGGPAGALGMGLHHGLYCVACCWGLMLVLFAVGIMSLSGWP